MHRGDLPEHGETPLTEKGELGCGTPPAGIVRLCGPGRREALGVTVGPGALISAYHVSQHPESRPASASSRTT